MSSSNILTNHQIPASIIELIEESKEYCFLVTPYFRPWTLLSRSLERAAKAEKRIVFVFRSGQVDEQFVSELVQYRFDMHFVDRLHTKLYLNEKNAIISSMNLYDSSKEFNYEVGYKISSAVETGRLKEEVIENDILGLDPKRSIPGRYHEYLQRLKSEKKEREKKNQARSNRATPKTPIAFQRSVHKTGHCLRCNKEIAFDLNAPLCYDCFQNWNLFGNADYQEKFCHKCGNQRPTSMAKPLCYECFTSVGS